MEDLFGTPAESKPAPEAKQPAEQPASVPEAPQSPQPAAPSGDDLFGTSEDLFGSSAESSPQAGDTPEAPSVPSAEDLFGTPAPNNAPAGADDLFGQESTTPAGDDFFGGSTGEEPSADDLFSPSPAEDATPQNGGGDGESDAIDLFQSGTDADDLFGPPSTEKSPESVGASDPSGVTPIPTSTESDPTADFDLLFGDPEEKDLDAEEGTSAAVDEALQTRTWTDNTGLYQVDARLVEVHPDRVRLLKTNGRTCTVPLRRLSAADLAIVARIAATRPNSDIQFISIEK